MLIRLYAGLLACGLGAGLLALVDPLVLRFLIDRALPRHSGHLVLIALSLLVLAVTGRSACTLMGVELGFQGYQSLTIQLRKVFLAHQLQLAASYHDATSTGEKQLLFLKIIDDVAVLWGEVIPSVLRSLLLSVLAIVALAYLAKWFAVGVMLVLPVYLLVLLVNRNAVHQATGDAAEALTDLSARSQEVFSTVVTAQLLARETRHRHRIQRGLTQAFRKQKKRVRTEMRYMIAAYCVTALGSVGLLTYGCMAVFAGHLSIGTLVAAYTYLLRVFEPAEAVADASIKGQRLMASGRQLDMFFALRSFVDERQGFRGELVAAPCSVRFSQVAFRYENDREWALRDASLDVAAGSFVGLVGKNGAGKSSMAKLLVRLYEPCRGRIELNGLDIRELPLKELRRRVQYVPQQPVLFAGSIASNVTFGMSGPAACSDSMIHEVLALVGLNEFLSGLPHGIETRVGEVGHALSGGQRQRLVLARAILPRPQVLVLDESTSALDIEGEEQVLRELRRFLPGSTVIVITHRVSSITWCDKMVLLEAGRVTDTGSHERLLSRCEGYRRLFQNISASEWGRI